MQLHNDGILRQVAIGLTEKSCGALVFLAGVGVGGAIVERAADGLMKAGGHQRLVFELAIDGGRCLLDGLHQGLGRVAARERIAAAEQIVGKKATDRACNRSLPIGVIAFASCAAIESETET